MQAVEAVNTVKVISGLNKMAALLKARPGGRAGRVGRWGDCGDHRGGGRREEGGMLFDCDVCDSNHCLAPRPCRAPPAPPPKQEQKPTGNGSDMLKDLAAYLTLEKAQVGG